VSGTLKETVGRANYVRPLSQCANEPS